MGKVFYDMGFLANATVVERSATKLIGSYVGHTGPLVQKEFKNALGRVLFIDEAYRLAGDGFAKEAMDEIVDCLTKLEYAQKLVVILAGYDHHINRLMAQNPGLTSRFPEAIVFRGLEPTDCLDLLVQLLRGRQLDMRKGEKDLDLSTLQAPTPGFKQETLDKFNTLGSIANWANARDVETIAKSIFRLVFNAGTMKETVAVITEDHVHTVIDAMISERRQRQDAAKIRPSSLHSDMMAQMQDIRAPPSSQAADSSSFVMKTLEAEAPQRLANDMPSTAPANETKRDSGITDAIWEQLQCDKQAAKKKEEQYQKLIQTIADAANDTRTLQQKEQVSEQAFEKAIEYNRDHFLIQEAKRLREEARLQHEMERRAQEELLAELESQRKAEEQERKREAKAQQQLKSMGICPMGYRWINQSGGYRCSAGGHFVTDSELGL